MTFHNGKMKQAAMARYVYCLQFQQYMGLYTITKVRNNVMFPYNRFPQDHSENDQNNYPMVVQISVPLSSQVQNMQYRLDHRFKL